MKQLKETLFTFLTILLLSIVFLPSCTAQNDTQASAKPTPTKERTAQPQPILCKEPRPQVCMQVYIPVCATRNTDMQCITTPCPATKKVTYSNACTACADSLVISYTNETCLK